MSASPHSLRFGLPQSVYTVGEFTAELKGLLQDQYPDVRIRGEISNARRYPSGHWYFTLKDTEGSDLVRLLSTRRALSANQA